VAGDARHAAAEPQVTLARLLAAGALALMLAITTTSAYIRLQVAGIGCADWPACYVAAQTAGGAIVDVDVARGVHRIVASLAGAWLLVMLVLAWGDVRGRSPRAMLVGLVVLAGLLAWLGLHTPSPLPAVALGNLLGGMTTVGMAAYLYGWCRGAAAADAGSSRRGEPGDGSRGWPVAVAFAAIALQVALGGLIGARGGAAACAEWPWCASQLASPGIGWGVFWPFAVDAADAAGHAPQARAAGVAALHAAHRIVALSVVASVAWVAIDAWRRRADAGAGAVAVAIAAALAVTLPAVGASMVLKDHPLATTLTHNLLAALLVAALAVLAGHRSGRTGVRSHASHAGARSSPALNGR
jgi:heme a synthase